MQSVVNICRLIDADRNLIEIHAWDCLSSDAFDRNLGDSLPALQEREFSYHGGCPASDEAVEWHEQSGSYKQAV